jgi:hypothetical protein
MPPTDLRRVHDVTDNFFFWQGLRWVPMGVALMIVGATMMPGVAIPKELRAWVSLPFVAVSLWLSTSVLGGYYARHFGRVQSDPSRHRIRSSVKWFIVYPAIMIAMAADAKLAPPVLASALVFALAIELYRESTGGERLHYVVAAVVLIAFALLPLLGVLPTGIGRLVAVIELIGAIYVVGGILDHREMTRVLGSGNVADVQTV